MMEDKHPLFLSRWTKLTIEAIDKGIDDSLAVHCFVEMKDKTLDFTEMNKCYVGEAYCFNFYGNNGHTCGDCDSIWCYPPEWMYGSVDSFLMWKDMFFQHMLVNHYERVKDL